MAVEIVTYRSEHFDGVDALWREAFPGAPPRNRAAVSIPAKLAVMPELFLIALEDGRVVGSTMAGYDGHRGWLHSVAVANSHRRRGVGTALVREAVARLTAVGCPKVNLQVLPENGAVVAFYQALGFRVEPRISMGMLLNPER